MNYRADIDGLRALAVLSVMLYHLNARWLPGGFVGVDVFFVISGFVVCASLASSDARRFSGFISEFYARRLGRIAPVLVVVLVTASIASTLFIPQAWLSRFNDSTALYAFAGLSNWLMSTNADTYFSPTTELNPYVHTWSLGLEEQFYLIFPLLCYSWVRSRADSARLRSQRPVLLLALLGCASLIGCSWLTRNQPVEAFYAIVPRFWELAAGALLYQATADRATLAWPPAPALSTYLPWIGLGGVAAGLALADAQYFPFPWALPPVLGTVLLIGGRLADVRHPVRRILANTAAVWIGKRSYSLYLWHWPVYVLLRWTVGLETPAERTAAVVGTVLLAWASYRLVELPARRSSLLARQSPVARVAVFLLVVLCGWKIVDGILWRNQSMGLSIVSRHPIDWYSLPRMPFEPPQHRECQVDVTRRPFHGSSVKSYRVSTCHSGSTGVGRHLIVFGDSHATAYLPLFDQLSAETGASVDAYTFDGCSYLDLLSPMEGRPSACLAFWQFASQEVLASAHAGDLLFLPSLRQRRLTATPALIENLEFGTQALADEAVRETKRAAQEASAWLAPFIDRGIAVLFEAPKPLFASPPFRCSDWFNASNPVCRGGLTQSRAALVRRRAPVVAAMDELAARQPAVRVWDPFPILCPEEHCIPFREGRPLFFDGDHVSGYGNLLLFPSFKAAVQTPRTGASLALK